MSEMRIGGHWQRESITAPGMEDRTTRVHWLQAEEGFCDIRIPLTRPDTEGAGALCELGADALLELMNGFGFAGTTQLQGDRCTWHRQIAFHGTPAGAAADVGTLRPGPGGRMIEDGAEGACREVWTRLSHAPCDHATWQLEDRVLHLAWTPSTFLLATGVPDTPDSLSLRQALEKGERPEAALADFFTAEYTLGHWDRDRGVARLSTDPLREGQVILSLAGLEDARLHLFRTDYFGTLREEVWHR